MAFFVRRNRRNKFSLLLIPALFVPFLCACSVNYDDVYDTADTVPELMLDNAVFTRVDNSRVAAEIKSTRLEEFKDSGRVLAEEIEFETMNTDGKTNAVGSAGIMCADTKNEMYEFYGGIHIEAPSRGVKIDGESLRWNGKTEQLTGERGKTLTLEKDGITLSGSGFSASAVSEQFNFAGDIFGRYKDEENE